MTTITETLCAIERRAERAIVLELRLMTQEILAMRTQLTLEDRTRADALLLKLDCLERCQRVDAVAPCAPAPAAAPAGPGLPVLSIEMLEPLQPSSYLIHFYSHDIGDLERVEFTEMLSAAAQLVRLHLAERSRPVTHVTHRANGELRFLTEDEMVLASIRPCEPSTPDVEPTVADACAALTSGDLSALRHLFVATPVAHPERLAT